MIFAADFTELQLPVITDSKDKAISSAIFVISKTYNNTPENKKAANQHITDPGGFYLLAVSVVRFGLCIVL